MEVLGYGLKKKQKSDWKSCFFFWVVFKKVWDGSSSAKNLYLWLEHILKWLTEYYVEKSWKSKSCLQVEAHLKLQKMFKLKLGSADKSLKSKFIFKFLGKMHCWWQNRVSPGLQSNNLHTWHATFTPLTTRWRWTWIPSPLKDKQLLEILQKWRQFRVMSGQKMSCIPSSPIMLRLLQR